MKIRIHGAREHNLKGIDVQIDAGLTVVTGVSGSGKTSLVFDTLYHESRRRFLEVFAIGSAGQRFLPADVDAIQGLGPAIAVGQNLLNRNPVSTLASASGLHPFFRLLYAKFGERACPRCGAALRILSADQTVERLVQLSAEAPLEVYAPLLQAVPGSHRTLLDLLIRSFDPGRLRVDGAPWDGSSLPADQPHSLAIAVGDFSTPHPLLPHQARQALQTAIDLGAQALLLVQGSRSLTLSYSPVCAVCGNWLEDLDTVHFNLPCPFCEARGCEHCAYTGLHPQAAAVRWNGLRLDELLSKTVSAALVLFTSSSLPPSAQRLISEVARRLEALEQVGLGYLTLDRPSPTLSRGEAQRVRLAVALTSRLEDMLHVLDEPTIGQHPADVARLLPAFRQLVGPVVFVEHDRAAAAQADHAIDLGPGAGMQGGEVIYSGSPLGLWGADTPSGRYFSQRQRVLSPESRPAPERFLTIQGASLRNLRHIDVPIPLERLTVVTGVSGSGKSTLVEDVLVASLLSKSPVGCLGIAGPTPKPVMVDQSPIGRNPRSNPATYTKLADILRDLFAIGTGLSPSHFSFNRPEGACPTCSGMGAVEVSMRYLPSTWIPCSDCQGERFSDEVLSARLPINDQECSIADFFRLPVATVFDLMKAETRLPTSSQGSALSILGALCQVGLGYIQLGQPSPTLSGGEAQRVKLARYLGQRSLSKQLLILDEPSTGLHPQDLSGLLAVLDRLVRAGATVVVVEHNTDVIRAADWVIDLGPGSGPQGGRLLYSGPPYGLPAIPESLTGRALAEEDTLLPGRPSPSHPLPDHIQVRCARANNLQGVDVDFPKGALSVVTGPSGSGKSSLVHDVLEAEARRRFLESLSMYERQSTREGPEAPVESVAGLGVAMAITPERKLYNRRATLGASTEISHHLAALFAALGERPCPDCGAALSRGHTWRCPACGKVLPLPQPRHFSASTYAAACLTCHGVGSLQVPRPEKLIIHPEKPLCAGAMYSPGFFPNGYLGKPFNGGYYMVRALAERYGFDPDHTPWNQMSPEAQNAFLFGDPQPMPVTVHSRTGRMYTHHSGFPGFYGFVRDWDVGGTYTDTQPCPQCQAARLRPEYLAVTFCGYNIYQLSEMPLEELAAVLASAGEAPSLVTASALNTVRSRLRFLCQVGLGYLHLNRISATLSAGEAQRVKLASLLGSGLTSLTVLLDEPTRGLHPCEVQALIEALFELRNGGNTLVVVEHDPLVISAADHLVDMGPGAGTAGGKVLAQGRPAQVRQADSLTAAWLRGERRGDYSRPRRTPQRWMAIHGARQHNLKGGSLRLPLGLLVGFCGVSGSGKSTLVMDTLGRALVPVKQTTSVAWEPLDPGEHDSIEGAPGRAVLVDQSRAHIHSPAIYLGLSNSLRTLYAASEDAQALGLDEQALSARCSSCGGRGYISMEMGFLPSIHAPCDTCRATGHLPEAWEVRLHGLALPELYGLTIVEVADLFKDEDSLSTPLRSACEVGLGYLVLRQPAYTLSGGEAQRLKIARELCRPTTSETLYILDEPTVGQHLEDVTRLNAVLHRLVEDGHSVFVVEHHPHLLAACDWLVELGPGGGPRGGHVIASGPPEALAAGDTPIATYLRQVLAGGL